MFASGVVTLITDLVHLNFYFEPQTFSLFTLFPLVYDLQIIKCKESNANSRWISVNNWINDNNNKKNRLQLEDAVNITANMSMFAWLTFTSCLFFIKLLNCQFKVNSRNKVLADLNARTIKWMNFAFLCKFSVFFITQTLSLLVKYIYSSKIYTSQQVMKDYIDINV